MLQTLHIENYALIQLTDIRFADGMTSITGETGAGKSILLGALGLLMGQRADSQVLKDKERKCVVEARFLIDGLGMESLFHDNDLDYSSELILRREILPSAKSRAFVNDTPVSLALLKEIASHILDIHSQHETLTLGDSSFQVQLLDTLGNCHLQPYTAAFHSYQQLKQRLESLTSADAQARKEQDYMQFLFDELMEANLSDGEQEELEQESRLLSHAEGIKEALGMVLTLCDGDSEESALARLNMSRTQLSRIASVHADAESISHRWESALIELKDILSEIESFNDRVQYSPERQQQVDARLDILYRLEKKHSVDSVDALIGIRNNLDTQLQQIAHLDEEIHEAMEAVDKAYALLQQEGEKLTKQRLTAARQLERDVLPLLADLGMKEARLEVRVEPTSHYHAHGCDHICFLFNANRGGDLRELGKVASGGELSRLMLALKSLSARKSFLPTIIFDEIDTGVSGDISSRMASILSTMSGQMQVIAITHLPQMAAIAHTHLKVYKQVEGDSTISRIRPLAMEERVHEIAVMLSSEPPTASAQQTARELLCVS